MSHLPLWFGRFPKSRRPAYPRLRGEHLTRVVVVGGGLTGVSCAMTLAMAGIDTVLLEGEVIGGGMTAGASGVLREGFAGSFREAAGAHGGRTARILWEGLRRGSLDFAAALRRHRIRCELAPQDVMSLAGPSAESGQLLKREHQARRDGGADGTWLTAGAAARETGTVTAGGIRTHGAAIDPYRACVGVAAAAAGRGARLHERSVARRIQTSARHVEVTTADGVVRAETVIVATGALIQDLRALRRHLRAEHVYSVVTAPLSAVLRRQVGQRRTVLEDGAGPARIVRWLEDDRILVQGDRQLAVPDRLRDRALTQRTGQLMYELSLLYPVISGLPPALSWDALDHDTADALPLLGPHRNLPRHFFAFGSSRHGAGLAWLAARLALRHVQGAPLKGDEAFGFSRVL
jgi:glycine/D-amino acid oxidase-like deaminating enzyme